MAEPRRFWGACVLLAGLLGLGHAPMIRAQDANNILGLPAVPQGPTAPASSAASTPAKPAVVARLTDAQIKAVLSGKITAASTYQDGLITVRVTTEKTFVGDAPRAQALQAAKLIQRDVRLACANLCRPAPMPVPVIRADNTLGFDIVVAGYAGSISQSDLINLVSGKRISAAIQSVPATLPSPPASAATSPSN